MDSNVRTEAMPTTRVMCLHSAYRSRTKEILDDPPLKAFIDTARKRYGKALINYPQPTEVQKQKLES